MALRKLYEETIKEESSPNVYVNTSTVPFAFGLDNGIVRLEQSENAIYLSYGMIARLHDIVFPSKSYVCNPETGCAEEVPSHATLNKAERIIMWARFPETIPNDISFEDFANVKILKAFTNK